LSESLLHLRAFLFYFARLKNTSMRNVFIGIIFCIQTFAFAQTSKGRLEATVLNVPAPHYLEEFTFDKPVDGAKWNAVKKGLSVSWGSTDAMYFRAEVPIAKEQTVLNEAVWKGERMNAVIVTWSPDTINQVRVSISDLTNASGDNIDRDKIKFSLIRYVVSNFPYGATNTTCGAGPTGEGYLMPDRLEDFDRYNLPGKTTRPIWLSIDVPMGTNPGLYKGTITVRSEKSVASLDLNLTVQKQILPKPSDWTHRLDLWQNPWVIAWYYKVKPWSQEHITLLRKHLKLYADAGGTFITTYTVHSPWSDNSYYIEGTMIDWIKQKNGAWKFDYSIFDQYVALCMEMGIQEAITIYTPIPWGNRFRYLDEQTGNYVWTTWAPDTKQFKDFWNTFLTDLKSHLEEKGWFHTTYIGINENEMSQTLAAIKVVREHSKDWKITYAGNWHKELDNLLDDYSFLYGNEPTPDELSARKQKGFTSTYYVCCNPAKPNNFVFSPPVEGRWISWYTAAAGYDGFLRWAYDAWPEDPSRDSRHLLWPSGDCFLIYPGANSSIRFEKLREGIVDFEKINILRGLAAKSNDKNIVNLWKNFEQHLKSLTSEKQFNESKLLNDINSGKLMLRELSEKL
jgi:hypothetical protein